MFTYMLIPGNRGAECRAYDGEAFSRAVLDQQPHAQVVIPLHKNAVCSDAGDTQRDQHIQAIEQHGRIAWQQKTGYGLRNLVELAMPL